ncbi:hypothetical protein Goarm_023353 [Gossypium armourianum]|uniref:Uncharacterized protein n=1 Tax=Gossypium armourianum TaxID=34283 RepID=A0A7J9KGG6_9ROSI|nr:hypothetical protein [Gossypium armourianum]
MSVFKYENSDGDGGVVENKLHQASAAIALIRALTVKVKGLFVQVENQALQSDPMFKDDSSGAENHKWLGIEFNWHPRILVVARSDVALLLDFRHNKCNVICLAKIEMLSPYDVVDEGQFLADILKLVCESDEFGGLILIRLMSSGKNEAQRYCASWDLVQDFDIAHKEPLFNFEDSLLYSSSDDEYEFPKRFKYLNLDYLCGYLNDNLAKGLDLVDLGPLLHFLSFLMWATFPLELLLLAFFSYPKLVDVPIDDMAMPLEFSVAPGLSQLPPFLLGKPSRRNT